tara:strand:+ start:627 stop:1061 length:435 start_codon:yes stop_codon:yes gene_type:complete
VTVYQFSNLPQWVAKVEKVADAVVKQATSDMLSSVEIVPGITRGGSRQRGTIPRDLGALASSLQSTIYGSTAISGANSYVLVAGQMQAGDIASFTWGGNAAPYARPVHYGANGVSGTFWVDVMAAGWSAKWVPQAVRKARNQFI